MACCKCCCGKKDCEEGDQGKCCCGDTCCAEGEFCCGGACQQEPCEECDCTNCDSLVWEIDPGDLDPACAYQDPEFGEVLGFDANFSGSIFIEDSGIHGGWKAGYPAALAGKCLRLVLDEAGCPRQCSPLTVYGLARRVRLFAYDCASKTVEDVTAEALEPPYSETAEQCGQGGDGDPLPFNDAVPTVACNQLP